MGPDLKLESRRAPPTEATPEVYLSPLARKLCEAHAKKTGQPLEVVIGDWKEWHRQQQVLSEAKKAEEELATLDDECDWWNFGESGVDT